MMNMKMMFVFACVRVEIRYAMKGGRGRKKINRKATVDDDDDDDLTSGLLRCCDARAKINADDVPDENAHNMMRW